MPPPPADSVASRLFLGPALRAQPDKRLVTLVSEGYETAFEEIVRRYGRQLGRYAAAIVGGRGEDVTQDAFSKALLAMRRDGTEIELRPWLYRIVRNTALNDLRDRPPTAAMLDDGIEGGLSAAEAAERREEIAELMQRLRALPEAQRAAIVMRELEGLSHDEIAAALGVSGGAARQAIYRARVALRDGFGMLLPLPLLKLLIDHSAEAAAAGAGGGAAVATSAALGGAGAGGALKIGAAAVLVAGSIGAGVAIHDHSYRPIDTAARAAALSRSTDVPVSAGPGETARAAESAAAVESGSIVARGRSGPGHSGGDRGRGSSSGRDGGHRSDDGGDHHSFAGPEATLDSADHGTGHGGDHLNGQGGSSGTSGEIGPGHAGNGGGGSGSGSGSGGHGGGGHSGSGDGDSGQGGPGPEVALAPPSSPPPPLPAGSSGSDDGSGSSSSDSGSGSSGGSGGGDGLLP